MTVIRRTGICDSRLKAQKFWLAKVPTRHTYRFPHDARFTLSMRLPFVHATIHAWFDRLNRLLQYFIKEMDDLHLHFRRRESRAVMTGVIDHNQFVFYSRLVQRSMETLALGSRHQIILATL